MKLLRLTPLLALVAPAVLHAEITPGEPIDVSKIVMQPKSWEKGGHEMKMVPWVGKHITFLTVSEDLDKKVMNEFIGHLDDAWALYEKVTHQKPRPLRMAEGKPTIIALPADNLTCGYGCGYVGATGIEMTHFYRQQFPELQADSKAVPHCFFYEMGRNYYTFGRKHSEFTTGFAVFMRYVCIDTLKLSDVDAGTRTAIEKAIDIYEESDDIAFLPAFTRVYGISEKQPRLKNHGVSDQPVMYASAMLKLRKSFGDEWVSEFFRQLDTCPPFNGDTKEGARNQAISWYVAASCAKKKDLSAIFAGKWRMELPAEAKKLMAEVDWKTEQKAGDLVTKLIASGGFPEIVE
jgi:hypothetical protein